MQSSLCFTVLFLVSGWRCKRYGHRTGDRECPFFTKGNQKLEQFRVVSSPPQQPPAAGGSATHPGVSLGLGWRPWSDDSKPETG